MRQTDVIGQLVCGVRLSDEEWWMADGATIRRAGDNDNVSGIMLVQEVDEVEERRGKQA